MCAIACRHLAKATEVTAGLAESNGSLSPGGGLVTCGLTLPVHQDQLRAQRLVTSMGKLYLYLLNAEPARLPVLQVGGNSSPSNG